MPFELKLIFKKIIMENQRRQKFKPKIKKKNLQNLSIKNIKQKKTIRKSIDF